MHGLNASTMCSTCAVSFVPPMTETTSKRSSSSTFSIFTYVLAAMPMLRIFLRSTASSGFVMTSVARVFTSTNTIVRKSGDRAMISMSRCPSRQSRSIIS